ncbi:MAG: septum formation initiator family protein [Patescibacteria group bacterium]|nr:septum formation initiator family protein [Patescibacteria group bacterium]
MKKRLLTKKWSLRLITVTGLVFVIFIAMGLVRELVNRYMVNQEIEKIQAEINTLERKNKELGGLVDYLNTDAFKEIQARQNLGMQKDGETAVSIESLPDNMNSVVELSQDNSDQKNKLNIEKWWNYFFTNN